MKPGRIIYTIELAIREEDGTVSKQRTLDVKADDVEQAVQAFRKAVSNKEIELEKGEYIFNCHFGRTLAAVA